MGVTIRYDGPPGRAVELARWLEDAGFTTEFNRRPIIPGPGAEIVHLLLRLESDAESGLVGTAAVVTAKRIIDIFRQNQKGVAAEIVSDGDTDVSRPGTQATAVDAGTTAADQLAEGLAKLVSLHDDGALDEREFKAAKTRLLKTYARDSTPSRWPTEIFQLRRRRKRR